MFGMNDIGRSNWTDATPSDAVLAARGKALENFGANLAKLADRFAAAGVPLALMTPTPFDQYNPKAGENIPFCNEPGLSAAAGTVRTLAASNGLEVVEFHRPMTKLFRESADDFVFCRDRVHPGEEGHLYMAAQVLEALGATPEADQLRPQPQVASARIRSCGRDGLVPEDASERRVGGVEDRLMRLLVSIACHD